MALQKNVRRTREYDDGELMHRQGKKPKGKKPNHGARQEKHNWDNQ